MSRAQQRIVATDGRRLANNGVAPALEYYLGSLDNYLRHADASNIGELTPNSIPLQFTFIAQNSLAGLRAVTYPIYRRLQESLESDSLHPRGVQSPKTSILFRVAQALEADAITRYPKAFTGHNHPAPENYTIQDVNHFINLVDAAYYGDVQARAKPVRRTDRQQFGR